MLAWALIGRCACWHGPLLGGVHVGMGPYWEVCMLAWALIGRCACWHGPLLGGVHIGAWALIGRCACWRGPLLGGVHVGMGPYWEVCMLAWALNYWEVCMLAWALLGGVHVGMGPIGRCSVYVCGQYSFDVSISHYFHHLVSHFLQKVCLPEESLVSPQ